ncbi:MAG: hypothetical protein GXO47_14200 [Chlorobi bacterium]|nr:hypothetical protein [Chlorobiota bacterium]
MNELFTLLASDDIAELESAFWLSVFEELPDGMFQIISEQPSDTIISILKQYGKVYSVIGNDGIVLN